MIDDFESYFTDLDVQTTWPDDIDGWQYSFLEAFQVYSGDKAMRFEYQNQYDPYVTTLTHEFAAAQDWTKGGLSVLSLHFRGDGANLEQPIYIVLEDATGPASAVTIANPYSYAALTETWQEWNIELSQLSDAGLDLSQIKKMSIRTGDGTPTGQSDIESDRLYFDEIKVCPLKCNLNSNADLDGNCKIDFGDFSAIAGEWLNEGQYVMP